MRAHRGFESHPLRHLASSNLVKQRQIPLLSLGYVDLPASQRFTVSHIYSASFVGWRPLEEARKFARNLGLKREKEWREYVSSGQRPDDIPSAPEDHYRNQGWTGHADWTGYDARKSKKGH